MEIKELGEEQIQEFQNRKKKFIKLFLFQVIWVMTGGLLAVWPALRAIQLPVLIMLIAGMVGNAFFMIRLLKCPSCGTRLPSMDPGRCPQCHVLLRWSTPS